MNYGKLIDIPTRIITCIFQVYRHCSDMLRHIKHRKSHVSSRSACMENISNYKLDDQYLDYFYNDNE